MKTADNVFQSITIWDQDNANVEFRGNGVISVDDYNTGCDIYIRLSGAQMKAISDFLRKAAAGHMDGIGNEDGGDA